MLDLNPEPESKDLNIIRIATSTYVNSKGELVVSRNFRHMRSLSTGYPLLEEELSNIGAEEVAPDMDMNLLDGLYIMTPHYECDRWGDIDGVTYSFTPYEVTS